MGKFINNTIPSFLTLICNKSSLIVTYNFILYTCKIIDLLLNIGINVTIICSFYFNHFIQLSIYMIFFYYLI